MTSSVSTKRLLFCLSYQWGKMGQNGESKARFTLMSKWDVAEVVLYLSREIGAHYQNELIIMKKPTPLTSSPHSVSKKKSSGLTTSVQAQLCELGGGRRTAWSLWIREDFLNKSEEAKRKGRSWWKSLLQNAQQSRLKASDRQTRDKIPSHCMQPRKD